MLKWMRGENKRPDSKYRVPSWKTGFAERTLFFFVTIVLPGKVITYMGVWMGLKMAANWNRRSVKYTDNEEEQDKISMFSISALFGNVASLAFAFIGGEIVLVYGCWPL